MKNLIKELLPYIIIIIIVILIRTFIITPILVSGDSMKPNLHNNEVLLVKKIGYNSSTIERFDIIIIKEEKEEIIKRVIGMPGEHISYKNNKLYVDDKLVNERELLIQRLNMIDLQIEDLKDKLPHKDKPKDTHKDLPKISN